VNLKSTITVKQYTNDGQLRKGYRFKKTFPVAVEGFTMDYDNTDYPIKSVTFACEDYEQLLGSPASAKSPKPPTPKPPTPKPPTPKPPPDAAELKAELKRRKERADRLLGRKPRNPNDPSVITVSPDL